MKQVCLYFLSLALCLTACGKSVDNLSEPKHGPQAPTWQEQYDLGIRYLSECNYQEAIIAFTAAIEIDPKQAPAYVGRGDAYISLEETEENLAAAQSDYEKAIELDGTEAELYRKIAEICERQGNLESAIEWLKHGVEATGDQSLQEYLDRLTEMFPPKFVMTRQDFYNGTGSEHGYIVYTYDEQGYLISRDSWAWNGPTGMEDWQNWLNVTWYYDSEKRVWIKTETEIHHRGTELETQVKEDEIVDRKPGLEFHNCIAAHGFIDGFAIGEAYEAELIHVDTDGHTGQYTYDENGNAVRVDTYAPDGSLSGWCILTWEELSAVD